MFQTIGLLLLAFSGAYVMWVGLRDKTGVLVRRPYERVFLVLIGVGAWVVALSVLIINP